MREICPSTAREAPVAPCHSCDLASGWLVSLGVPSGLSYGCWFIPGICVLGRLIWSCWFVCGVCLSRGTGLQLLSGIWCLPWDWTAAKEDRAQPPKNYGWTGPLTSYLITFLFHYLYWVVSKRRVWLLLKIGCKNLCPYVYFVCLFCSMVTVLFPWLSLCRILLW